MRVRRAGASALLLECRDGEQVEAWRHELWRRREAGELVATEIVPGARTVLLDGVPPGTEATIAGWPDPPRVDPTEGPLVNIPVTFDGQDLPDVASLWRVSAEEAVARLVATPFVVAFCGFAPGFGYLRGLPSAWAVPRLTAPRPRVPAGSVGLADAYAGIYPSASPGGWRLVGRTDEALWDVRASPPALLSPGTRVRLVAA
jgi:KipI family sensor histidine kinase inhibitor